MNPNYQSHGPLDLRSAIIRQVPRDLLLAVAMWLVPVVFLAINPWAKHWCTYAVLVGLGVFVIGGTTLTLPAIAIKTLPPEELSIWTPLRCVGFVLAFLMFWSLTYAVMM